MAIAGKKALYIASVLVVIVLIYTAFAFKPKPIETFVDQNVKSDYLDALYSAKGVEPCSILGSSNYMSMNYIDTLRIRKWKPEETDPRFAEFTTTQSNNDYCYFFMDDDKRILKTDTDPDGYASVTDPLANFTDCSKMNPLFKQVPVVSDVFESTGYDLTHKLPYKKCVIKIDKASASNPDQVEALWAKFGGADANAFCEGISNTLMGETRAYQDKLNELHNSLKTYRDQHTSVPNLRTSLSNCLATNTAISAGLNTNNEQLKDLQTTITSSNQTLMATASQLQEQLTSLQKQLAVKTTDLTALQNNFTHVITIDLAKLTQNMRSTTTLRDKCRSDQAQVLAQLQAAQANLERLTTAYRQLTIDYAQCEKIQKELINNIADQKPRLLDIEQKLDIIREQVKKCLADQASLIQEERMWTERTRITRANFDRCNDARAKIEASISSLKREREILGIEIEDIKRRCREDQSSFNMATVNIHRDAAKDIISTEQQRCSASIAMRKRRTELLNEINGILSQATGCDRVVSQCKCYKRVATFAWNDDGVTGARMRTTSGRIDEIRKHLGQAPIIKFQGPNGVSEFHRITKTRRKKGGGSYIDVAGGYRGPGGLRTAIMYQEV